MIFYRSEASAIGAGPSLKTLRVLTSFALAAYPAGALFLGFWPAEEGGIPVDRIMGLGLISAALVAATPVLGSRLQRIVGEAAKGLDEFELALRHRALSWGYGVLSAVTLLAIFYGGVATDAGLWLPSHFEHWNTLFWGTFLYASLLPTAFLAWTMADPVDED